MRDPDGQEDSAPPDEKRPRMRVRRRGRFSMIPPVGDS